MQVTEIPEQLAAPLGPPPGIAGYRLLNLLEPPRPRRIAQSPRAALLVVATVCVGAFMGQLDASIVSVALPRMSEQLHVGVSAVEWVSLSYVLTLVALVVPIGAWADVIGRKSLYVGGFAVFTVASAACALAPDLTLLCIFRVVQAIGAALMQANSTALIASVAPRDQLGRMVGLQAAAQAIGLAAGPAAGGALLAAGSWRWLFLVNVPAGLLGVATAALLLPRSRDLASGPHRRLGRVVWSVLRAPRLARSLAGAFTGYVLLFATLVAVPLYLRNSGRGAPAATGLMLAVLPVAIGLAAPVAGHFADRAPTLVARIGLGLGMSGVLGIVTARPDGVVLVGLLAAVGVGLGSFTPANNRAVMVAAPVGSSGAAAGLLNMTRGLGTAAGTALAVLLLA